MSKETLKIANAILEISIIEKVIYISVSGEFTDEVLLELSQYVHDIIDQIPENSVRVWDTSGVPAAYFKLTGRGIDKAGEWVKKIKVRRPDSIGYLVSPSMVNFGISRLLEIKSGLKETGTIVITSINDLPPEIKSVVSGLHEVKADETKRSRKKLLKKK